jgi:hypothetical protein
MGEEVVMRAVVLVWFWGRSLERSAADQSTPNSIVSFRTSGSLA